MLSLLSMVALAAPVDAMTGWRGLAWGSAPPSDCAPVALDGLAVWCERPGSPPPLGAVHVASERLVFYDSRLEAVVVDVHGVAESRDLFVALVAQFKSPCRTGLAARLPFARRCPGAEPRDEHPREDARDHYAVNAAPMNVVGRRRFAEPDWATDVRRLWSGASVDLSYVYDAGRDEAVMVASAWSIRATHEATDAATTGAALVK